MMLLLFQELVKKKILNSLMNLFFNLSQKLWVVSCVRSGIFLNDVLSVDFSCDDGDALYDDHHYLYDYVESRSFLRIFYSTFLTHNSTPTCENEQLLVMWWDILCLLLHLFFLILLLLLFFYYYICPILLWDRVSKIFLEKNSKSYF
jgi:hypothetical protein